jgi:hypothetical protein
MGTIKRVMLATLLAVVLAVTSLLALAYGWVPLPGDKYIKLYLGAVPDGFIAWHSSGWTDHQTYFIFKADRAWVERAVRFARLEDSGETVRSDCVEAPRPPWWFKLSPETPGRCWRRQRSYGGGMMLHFVPSTAYVYIFDYST